MLPGFSAKKLQGIMKQIGMKQEEIDAEKVIIEKKDGTKLIFKNPNIVKIEIQGQETYQISGEAIHESAKPEISEEDINTIIQQTGCTKEKAKEILEETKGDLAEAILKLKA